MMLFQTVRASEGWGTEVYFCAPQLCSPFAICSLLLEPFALDEESPDRPSYTDTDIDTHMR